MEMSKVSYLVEVFRFLFKNICLFLIPDTFFNIFDINNSLFLLSQIIFYLNKIVNYCKTKKKQHINQTLMRHIYRQSISNIHQ